MNGYWAPFSLHGYNISHNRAYLPFQNKQSLWSKTLIVWNYSSDWFSLAWVKADENSLVLQILRQFSLASFCALSSVYHYCVHLSMAHDYLFTPAFFLFLQPSLNFSLNPLTFSNVTILCVWYSSRTFTLLGCKLFLPTCLYQPTNLGWRKFVGPGKFWDTSHCI